MKEKRTLITCLEAITNECNKTIKLKFLVVCLVMNLKLQFRIKRWEKQSYLIYSQYQAQCLLLVRLYSNKLPADILQITLFVRVYSDKILAGIFNTPLFYSDQTLEVYSDTTLFGILNTSLDRVYSDYTLASILSTPLFVEVYSDQNSPQYTPVCWGLFGHWLIPWYNPFVVYSFQPDTSWHLQYNNAYRGLLRQDRI